MTRAWLAAVLAPALLLSPVLIADNLVHDSAAPNMQSVNDVLNGQRFLLEDDDITLLTVYPSGSGTTTDLVSFQTSNSRFGAEQTLTLSTGGGTFPDTGVQGSAATGRMFNVNHDVVVAVAPGEAPAKWTVNILDPAGNQQTRMPIGPSQFDPYGQIYSQVVMGDFTGNGLSDALLFYASVDPGQHIEWGMSVLTAGDVSQVGSFAQGPQFYNYAAQNVPAPVTGSIVVADFNGDGRDEIAALLTDSQTIQFYTVDPATLVITPSVSLKLPQAVSPGTLAAGRFRNTPNDELVAVGQIAGHVPANTIYSIQTMQTGNNGNAEFSPVVAQIDTVTGYGRGTQVGGILAQAAPVIDWYQGNSEQLVIGLQYNTTPTGIVWIGSFDSNFQFYLDMATDVEGEKGCLLGMQVGNFDHQQPPDANGNTHNPGLQLALFELQDSPSACTPRNGDPTLKIVNINAPSAFNALNQGPPANNWLQDSEVLIDSLKLPAKHQIMQVLALGAGDLEGRSLRLGAPEKAVVPEQIQPTSCLGYRRCTSTGLHRTQPY